MSNKPKLLFFESLSNISGGQRVLLNLLTYFREEFEITVVLPREGALKEKLDELGIKTIFINPGSYSLGKKNIWQIIKYLYFLPLYIIRVLFLVPRFDLLYVNSVRLLPMIVFANFVNRRPIILHSHSLISDKKSLYLTESVANKKTVKKIICVSNFIVSKDQNLKEKTIVIYNGVDINNFYPNLDKFSIKEKIQILIIGDLIPTKGQDKLLLALSSVNYKNWHLKIIGASRPGDESYAKELISLANNLKLSSQVEFIGRKENIADYLRGSDLLVLTSIVAEACPMAVLEAMACGVPVIASNLGGTSEIIKDDSTGYLFITGDEKNLAKILDNFFLLTPNKISELKLNCRREAELKYNLEDSANKIKRIINNVLNEYETPANK